MLRSVFLRTVSPPTDAEHSLYTLSVFRGPDWCLQELQDTAGATVRTWSYAIDKQDMLETPVGEVLHLQVTQKGRDWVGDCLLETGKYPCTLGKENEKGVILQFEGREQILWRGEGGWPEARAWATAVATASAGLPPAPSRLPHTPSRSALFSGTEPKVKGANECLHPFRSSSGPSVSVSAVTASAVRSVASDRQQGIARWLGEPTSSAVTASADRRPHGGHGGHRGRPSASVSAPVASASAICKIRLPGS